VTRLRAKEGGPHLRALRTGAALSASLREKILRRRGLGHLGRPGWSGGLGVGQARRLTARSGAPPRWSRVERGDFEEERVEDATEQDGAEQAGVMPMEI